MHKMKSLEENIFEIEEDMGYLSKDFRKDELPQSQIEEIILKSINDQDSLFNHALFSSDNCKITRPGAYAQEIIDMCAGYSLECTPSSLPEIDPYFARPTPSVDPEANKKKKEEKKDNYQLRPFICTYVNCFKAFKRFEHLKRHYRIHTGEKPYRCSIRGCNKTFSRSDNLMQHMKTHASKSLHEF